MQRVGTTSAEVSCLKKLQFNSQNDSVITVGEPSFDEADIEKGEVKAKDVTTSGLPVLGSPNNQVSNKKGIIEQKHQSGSDGSYVTTPDEKDDFPEGGLKA
jgi:hypothetical protein